jgi:hypothetical protein
MINTAGDIVMGFKGKKAAPFKKGGGRKKKSTKTAKGTRKRRRY